MQPRCQSQSFFLLFLTARYWVGMGVWDVYVTEVSPPPSSACFPNLNLQEGREVPDGVALLPIATSPQRTGSTTTSTACALRSVVPAGALATPFE
jgi:hypothetical protein